MKSIRFTKEGDQVRIEDYPDAVALVEINDPHVPTLQSLSLHQVDLTLARAALDYIQEHNADGPLREVLWYSAIARYFKCFQKSESRIKLEPTEIFAKEPSLRNTFHYFKALRNKHLLHDENGYSQCLIGAVINKPDLPFKIGDIISLAVNADTSDQSHYERFFPLIRFTHEWIIAKAEQLCIKVAKTLESMPYESLVAGKPIFFSMPDDIDKKR